jgi:general secretion pathway protein L
MDMITRNTHFRISPSVKHWVGGFWSWWHAELAALLPKRLRRAILPDQERLFLKVEGSDLVVSQGTVNDMKPVERHALQVADEALGAPPAAGNTGGQEMVLCLPRNKVLNKTITLPLVAEENLHEVLAFEMDRHTPFTPEQVYYDYAVVARVPADNTLTVDLFLAPREGLDELLASVARLGFEPDRFMVRRNQAGDLHPVNLLPAQGRNRKPLLSRRINIALAGLALLLLIGAVATPLLQKRQVIRTLEPQLQSATEQARQAQSLRQEIDRMTAESRFLVERKQSTLLVLELINEFTRLLPDDTWISRLEINGTEVQIQGNSSAAAALIPLLESSASLHNVRFRSPVTQVPRSDAERFHLSADIVQAVQP